MGFDSVLIVVDWLSKYAYSILLKHPFTAGSAANIFFLKEVVRLHGIPRSIVSDRDKIFTSIFWEELFHCEGTILCQSTAYHPQMDGQTQVINQSHEAYLCCFAMDTLKKWFKWLAWAEFCYNTSFYLATKMISFEVVYGRPSLTILTYAANYSPLSSVDQQVKDWDAMLATKAHLHAAQQRMKAHSPIVWAFLCPCKGWAVAYKLALLHSTSIHPEFHIS